MSQQFDISSYSLSEGIPEWWDQFAQASPEYNIFTDRRFLTLDYVRSWQPVCYKVTPVGTDQILWTGLLYTRKIRFGFKIAIPGVNIPLAGLLAASRASDQELSGGLAALFNRLRRDFSFCQLPLTWKFCRNDLLDANPAANLYRSGTTLIQHWQDATEDELLKKYSSMRSRLVRKAKRAGLAVVDSPDGGLLDEFYAIYRATFSNQNLACPMSGDAFRSFCRQAVELGIGELRFAKSGSELAAGMLTLNDKFYSYYILGAFSDELKATNAFSLLMHERILSSLQSGRGFDFEGSRVPQIRAFFESFGGEYVAAPVVQLSSGLIGRYLSGKFAKSFEGSDG